MKEIILITDSMNRIPQKKHETESIDINLLSSILCELKYKVNVYNYYEIVNNFPTNKIKNKLFFYASSQYPMYKSYIQDCLLYIHKMGGKLIPSFSHFIAHENKAFQELEKKRLNINAPAYSIVSTEEEALRLMEIISFPFVAKISSGFASRGVKKITNKSNGARFVKSNMRRYDGLTFSEKIIHMFRKLKFPKRYPRRTGKLIFQELIPNLEYDWKVLVFFDRIYCLKRYTRKNDFRASGSGLFDFTEVPSKLLLDFALDSREKLNVPMVSLDIVSKENKCYLIEYQAVHFGLITAIKNDNYYSKSDNNQWERNFKNHSIEYDIAYAINKYVH